MNFVPEGIIVAMVTPFDRQENINAQRVRDLTNFLLKAGVHGLFPTGSQGEFYALEEEEKYRIWETVTEEVNGRVPVYAGTGAITTRETIKLTQLAEKVGIDAVSVITPFYIRPSQEELYEHYVQIAKSTHLPLLLYNNPARTGHVKLNVSLVKKLSEIDNIIGIKDSSGDMDLTIKYIQNTDSNFSVLAGRDTLIYGVLMYGGKGAISATANVVPEVAVQIYQKFREGDYGGALKAQQRLAPVRNAFALATFPVMVKEALDMRGIPVGPARKPVRKMNPEARKKLREILKGIEII